IPQTVLSGASLSQAIFLVLAALAVTTEYRFGTVRTSFLAVPGRTAVLVAKTVVLMVLGAVSGFVAAVGAFLIGRTLAENAPLPLELTGETWRVVAGHGAVFAVSAVLAVAVGALIRQSAGAIAILVIWLILAEPLLTTIPVVGEAIGPYLPFSAGARFVSDDTVYPGEFG